MGWSVLEELQWGDKQHPWVRPGQLFTRGPGTYKIPSVNDIPIDFRVSLLQNAPNPRAIHSSKVGGRARMGIRERNERGEGSVARLSQLLGGGAVD